MFYFRVLDIALMYRIISCILYSSLAMELRTASLFVNARRLHSPGKSSISHTVLIHPFILLTIFIYVASSNNRHPTLSKRHPTTGIFINVAVFNCPRAIFPDKDTMTFPAIKFASLYGGMSILLDRYAWKFITK